MNAERLVFVPSQGKSFPFYMETIGTNPSQEKINRPNGYPFYHWIQTTNGAGKFTVQGTTFTLKRNSGILLSPNTPHSYQAANNDWETIYITFSGALIEKLIHHLELPNYAYYEWEAGNPLSLHLTNVLRMLEHSDDIFGVQASTEVYHFLILLNKYGKLQKNSDISTNLEKLQPLIKWMEANISNPNVGLNQMAEQFGVSPRQLHTLFQKTFDASPYAYFLQLRIKIAKQLLLESREISVKEVSKQVGFRSPSHFVATFKKLVGFPPEQFRVLH